MKLAYLMAAVASLGLLACSRADTAPVKRTAASRSAPAGTVVIAPQFADAEGFAGDLARVEVGKTGEALSGYIDSKGKFKVNPKYRSARDFNDGLAAVNVAQKDEWMKWGYIDATGKTVVEPQFGTADQFMDGHAVVTVGNFPDGLSGLIDKRGQFVINPQYLSLYAIAKDRYAYRSTTGDKTGMLDANGKKIGEPRFTSLHTFAEGLAAVSFGKEANGAAGKCGYIDADGHIAIEPQFERCEKFSDGLALVAGVVDGAGGWGYIDNKGRFVIKPQYALADGFNDGLAAVAIGTSEANAKWGFIDKAGAMVISPQFDEQRKFANGFAVVRVGGGFGEQERTERLNALDRTKPLKAGKWGAIDKQGKFVVNPIYDMLGAPQEGLAPMRTGDHLTGKWGYIAL